MQQQNKYELAFKVGCNIVWLDYVGGRKHFSSQSLSLQWTFIGMRIDMNQSISEDTTICLKTNILKENKSMNHV